MPISISPEHLQEHDVAISRTRLAIAAKYFPVSGIKLLNKVPLNVRNLPRPRKKVENVLKRWLLLNPE